MEFMVEIVFSAIGELLIQLVGEGLIEGGWRLFVAPFSDRRRVHPIVAGAGLLGLGGIMGWIGWLVVPAPLLSHAPLPGASLLLSPLMTGGVMEFYGRWRSKRGHATSSASTFWGGALFAFGMALARFLLQRP